MGAAIPAIVVLAAVTAGFTYFRRHDNEAFVHTYVATVQANGRAFLIGHDSLVNDIPRRVLQSNEKDQWKQLSGAFYSDVRALEKFYAPIAECLNKGSCWPQDEDGPFCGKAALEMLAYEDVMRRLSLIEGISINRTSGDDPLGDSFGSSFQVTPVSNLKTITERACAKKLDSLVQSLATKRPERIAAARAAWEQIKTRVSVLEMRDFPVSFDVAFEAISKSEFEQAVQKASEATKEKIQAQLCQLHRDMEGVPADFDSRDKDFPKYVLSPACRLEQDGSRKCIWSGFYSQANRLIIGRAIASADEARQTSFLNEMVKGCVPSSCQFKKETPRSGQNALGFACRGLDREYECQSDAKPLVVSLMTCFNSSSLEISTPAPRAPIPQEENVVTPDIKEVADGYRQCQGKITLRGCLAQIRAVRCKDSQGSATNASCGADVLTSLKSLSSQCLASAFSSVNWSTGDSWGVAMRETGMSIDSVPALENALILQFYATRDNDASFGRLLTTSYGSGSHVIVDGKRFDYSVNADDLLKALLAGNSVQIRHLDYADRYETVPLSKFRVLYEQVSGVYKGCGFWEGGRQ